MDITAIADLHGHYPELEGGDLLIVAGDLTARDMEAEHGDFYNWFSSQDYRKRIYIPGNHDGYLQKYWDLIGVQNNEGLCDSGIEFEGLKIWGSPWTLAFPGMNPSCKAFTVETEDELAEKWALIPDDIDILITHSPPYDILDGVRRYGPFSHEREDRVGSKSLLIRSLDLKPLLHVFGHIHEQGGKQMALNRSVDGTENKTVYINASHVNERYEPVNKPIRVIL